MSADNILIQIESPRRDGKGSEWRVMDASFSSYYYQDGWETGEECDALIMQLRTIGWLTEYFETEEAADRYVEEYCKNNIVEYGASGATLQFPWPTEEEFKACEVRWVTDSFRRGLADKILFAKNGLEALRFEIICRISGLEKHKARRVEYEGEDLEWWDECTRLYETELQERQELLVASLRSWTRMVHDYYQLIRRGKAIFPQPTWY